MSSSDDPWAETADGLADIEGPLRPQRSDTEVVETVAAALASQPGTLDAVILGLTPETIACRWPSNVRLRAFDNSPAMLRAVWPVAGAPAQSSAEIADWLGLPVADGSVDLVAADGALSIVRYPDEARALVRQMKRVLRPRGRLVVRTFLRPDAPEAVEDIMRDLDGGRIAGQTALKMRLGATIKPGGLAGFSLRELWTLWQELFPDEEAAAERYGWPLQRFRMVSDYSVDIRVVYPTLGELRAVLDPEFDEIDCCYGNYELAERTPTLVLVPR